MATFLEFAARGRIAWWRYLAVFALAMAAWLLLAAGLIFALMVSRLAPPDLAEQLQRPTHPVVFFVSTGVMFGALLAGFVAAIRLIQAKRFGDVVGRWSWPMVAWGAGVWGCIQIAAVLIDFAIAPHGFRVTASGATALLAIPALFGLAVQTFAEEFVFRGWLTQGLLLATRRPLAAAALSGVLFGALHIANGIPQAIGAVAFGVVTALIAIRTGGIAFTFGLHLMNNLFGAVVVVSAADVFRGTPGLITQATPQLIWWDAAVATVSLIAALWIATVRARPRRNIATGAMSIPTKVRAPPGRG